MPTFDDRFQQFTAVWTNQLSDKSVWTTRVASLGFNTSNTVGGKAPWEYEIQNPFSVLWHLAGMAVEFFELDAESGQGFEIIRRQLSERTRRKESGLHPH